MRQRVVPIYLSRTMASCRYFVVVAAITGVSWGCSPPTTRFVTGLSAEERAHADTLPVYREGLPNEPHERIGPVEGLSCQITRDDDYEASEANALKEIRRATVRVGGTAVGEVVCEPLDRSQSSRRCFRSVVCRGTALEAIE